MFPQTLIPLFKSEAITAKYYLAASRAEDDHAADHAAIERVRS
jgi:hypothetical protein